MPTFDAPVAPIDAPFLTDAFVVPPSDAGAPDAPRSDDASMTTPIDAFAAGDAAATSDAFSPRDAFATSDAPVARDAFRDDAGPVTCTPLPATGSISASGDTSLTGVRWLRPFATTCPATSYSAVGTDVPYQSFVFCNEGAAGTFDLEVTELAAYDSYLVVYDGPVIPADSLVCLAGDDDSGASGALVSGLALDAGATITVVVSGFDNVDAGAFTLDVTRR